MAMVMGSLPLAALRACSTAAPGSLAGATRPDKLVALGSLPLAALRACSTAAPGSLAGATRPDKVVCLGKNYLLHVRPLEQPPAARETSSDAAS